MLHYGFQGFRTIHKVTTAASHAVNQGPLLSVRRHWRHKCIPELYQSNAQVHEKPESER